MSFPPAAVGCGAVNMKRIPPIWPKLRALALAGAACLATNARAAETPTPAEDAERYVRFVSEDSDTARLETKAESFVNEDGVLVTLVGVVHVGDRAYYEQLAELFTHYDAVLYEMIRDVDDGPPTDMTSDHPISQMQLGMRSALGLTFQLEEIDYTPANFVHADLDPETFDTQQKEKGESLFGTMLKASLEERNRQLSGQSQGMNPFALVGALFSDDRPHKLKLLLGRQMADMEESLKTLEAGKDGTGSVIITGRNERAMEVLAEELEKGRRKLAIFYGAGHMADFRRRLLDDGYAPLAGRWLTAWDIRRTPSTNAAPADLRELLSPQDDVEPQ